MPLFALALNFGWEFVYAIHVAESPLEKSVFTIWLLIDGVMLYGVLKFAHYEWKHSPWIARNIGLLFTALVTVASVGHWTFAKWWLDNEIGKREGKFYRGVVGPDTTELGFWSAAFCQAYLSAVSLVDLVVRQHSGGVSWGIWVTRTFGSIIGLYLNYGWAWWFSMEAHGYFVSPFALFLWAGGFICDAAYAFVL